MHWQSLHYLCAFQAVLFHWTVTHSRSSVTLHTGDMQCKDITPVLQPPSRRVDVHLRVTQATAKIFSASVLFIGTQPQDRACFQSVKNSGISESLSCHALFWTDNEMSTKPFWGLNTWENHLFHEHIAELGNKPAFLLSPQNNRELRLYLCYF